MNTPAQVAEEVKKLYDQVPYSAYDADYFPVVKSMGLSEQEFGIFAKDKQAIEIGCGGGQLSLFLSKHFFSVTAVDISANSLKAAQAAAEKFQRNNINFLEANLFDDNFLKMHTEKYDFVLCYGVLHHTHNAAEGFSRLVQLLKPGGFMVTGVYSRTQIAYRLKRQIVLWFAGDDWQKREKIARKLFFKGSGNEVSIFDGYVHPQVSFHSVAQVYSWIKKAGLNYVGSWPNFELAWYLKKIFLRKTSKNFGKWNYNGLILRLVELLWLISGKQVMVSTAAQKK